MRRVPRTLRIDSHLMIFSDFSRDVSFAARLLWKNKHFSLFAILSVGLGLGVVVLQAALISSLLFRLLPFPESDRLFTAALSDRQGRGAVVQPDAGGSMRLSDFLDIQREQRSFSHLVGFIPGTLTANFREESRRLRASAVSHDFFQALGVQTSKGRNFTAEDDRPGAEGVVIISHRLWEESFGGDPDIIGRTFRVAEEIRTVIGVMPEGFEFPRVDNFWVPLQTLPYSFEVDFTRRILSRHVGVIGRLRAGVTREQARAELSSLAANLANEHPATNKDMTTVAVEPLAHALLSRTYRQTLYVMMGAAVAILIIASFNVMNLQLARGIQRWREMTVRSALGATRTRLLRQALTESALLAACGGAAGVAFAWYGLTLVQRLIVASGRSSGMAPPWARVDLDGRVLALTLIALLIVVIFSGLLPAWLASRSGRASISHGGRGVTSGLVNRLSRVIVIAQIACTGPLLVGSILMTMSVLRQRNFDFGFPTDSLATNRLSLRGPNYLTDTNRRIFQDNLQRNLLDDPSISDVALTSRDPGLHTATTSFNMSIELEGQPPVDGQQPEFILYEYVSWNYLPTLGIPMLIGRNFEPADSEPGPGVVIVNAAFMRRHFPNAEALGKRFRRIPANPNQQSPWVTIVGVVPDFAIIGPLATGASEAPLAFLPIGARSWVPSEISIVVRGPGDPELLGKSVSSHVSKLDPNLALYTATLSPTRRLLGSLRHRTNITVIFCALSVVSVALAMAGLYGIMTLSVNQRANEFGLRIALGATRTQIIRQVLIDGGRQLLIGGSLALALTFVVIRVAHAHADNFIHNIPLLNWPVYAIAASILIVVTLLACSLPARRATRTSPMEVLRAE